MGKPTQRDEIPLHPQVALEPFDKWGREFLGPIDSPSRQKKYIIDYTDYLTKSAKTKVVKNKLRRK